MSDRTASGLLRSSVAATLSQVWRYGVAFVTRVLLRRGEVLVSSAGWGLWHWSVDTVFSLLAQVRDLGVPAHVVRSRPRPWGNFLALEAVWGVTLGLGVVVAAPWLAGELDFDPQGDVVRALRLLVLFFVFEGLARVPLTWFECELRLDRTLAPEVVRNLVWAGLAIGLAVAVLLGRRLEGLLYGVRVTDATTLVATAAVLATVAILANLLPTRRATAVDPVRVLRAER
jgi:hypothetical protein